MAAHSFPFLIPANNALFLAADVQFSPRVPVAIGSTRGVAVRWRVLFRRVIGAFLG